MTKTRRFTVRLTPEHWNKLERLAGTTGATPSDVIRAIVDKTDDLRPVNKNTQSAELSTVSAMGVG